MKRFFLSITTALCIVGCAERRFNSTSDETAFQAVKLDGKYFIKQGEVVLTLDDGPGAFSAPLATYLKKKNVPTVFFFNYKNVGNLSDPEQARRVQDICDLGIHTIANHRDTHDSYSAASNVWKNLDDMHKIIKEKCPKQKYIFFRPPGSVWALGSGEEGNAANLNMAYDEAGNNVGLQYIGPISWDFGCDTNANCASSDWRKLRDNYLSAIAPGGKCKGGIVLAHDVHETTVRAISGFADSDLIKGLANNFDDSQGLIEKLAQAGCKFVALDKDTAIIDKLLKNGPSMKDIAAAATKATAVVSTLLKSAAADSSKPESKPVCAIAANTVLEFSKMETVGAHKKITLKSMPENCKMNSTDVYVFAAHFKF
jgi:peptidoglycan/xylan/chitin deacetylase (PgdA/CDA1 family)